MWPLSVWSKAKSVKDKKEEETLWDGPPSSPLVKDTEEMVSWRGMSQEEEDECWMRIAGQFEEVLDKYKVENSRREAYKGRGALLEWALVRRSKNYWLRK